MAATIRVLTSKSISTKFKDLLVTPRHFGVEFGSSLMISNQAFSNTDSRQTIMDKIGLIGSGTSLQTSESKEVGYKHISVLLPLEVDLFIHCLKKYSGNLETDSKLLALSHLLQQLPYYIEHRDEKFVDEQELRYFQSPTLPRDNYYILADVQFSSHDKWIIFVYIENAEKQGRYRNGYISANYY